MNKYIDSIHNKIIKEVISLQNKKDRDKKGLFVLEGERLISEIPPECDVKYLIASDSYSGDINEKYPLYKTSEAMFRKISDTINPQGILAVCSADNKPYSLLSSEDKPLYIILENVMDPGNMGTIIRTADAAGADAVFLSKGCVDIYNPKVLRSTMGSVFHLPIYRNIDLTKLLSELNDKEIMTLGAHLKGNCTPYAVDMKKACAILIGNEANGLSETTSENASSLVRIPMPGKAESMNAAVAAAVLIYEAVRQRLEV